MVGRISNGPKNRNIIQTMDIWVWKSLLCQCVLNGQFPYQESNQEPPDLKTLLLPVIMISASLSLTTSK